MKTILFYLCLFIPAFTFSQLSHISTEAGTPFQYLATQNLYQWTQYTNSKGEKIGIHKSGWGFRVGRYKQPTYSWQGSQDYSEIITRIKGLGFFDFYKVGDHLYLVYSQSRKGSWDLFAQEIDFTTGVPKADVRHLAHTDEPIVSTAYETTTDHKNFLFSYIYEKDARKNPRMGFISFDENLNVLRSETNRPAPFSSFSMYNDDVNLFVDSKKTLYMTLYQKKINDNLAHLYILKNGESKFDDIILKGGSGEKPYFHFDEKADGVYLSAYRAVGILFSQESAQVALYHILTEQKKAETIIDHPIVYDAEYKTELDKFLKNEFGGVVKSWYYLFKPQQLITFADNSKFIIGYAETGEHYNTGFTATYIDENGKYQWTRHLFSEYSTHSADREFLVDASRKVLYLIRPYKQEFVKNSVSKTVYPDIRLTSLDAAGKVADKVILGQASGVSNIVKTSDKELDAEVMLYRTDDGEHVLAQRVKVTMDK